MEVGQRNKRQIGAIIQARMGSSRMPGKVLMPVPIHAGPSVLGRIVDTVRCIPLVGTVAIATSGASVNDPIREYAEKEDVYCYNGSENDVLSRFIAIIEEKKLDIVIRLTADDPLISRFHLNRALEEFIHSGIDYLCTRGLPLGMNIEIASAKALVSLQHEPLTAQDREHVTLFLVNSGKYKVKILNFSVLPELKGLRCTIDYPSDYAMMNILFSLNDFDSEDNVKELENLLLKYPWIAEINKSNYQKANFHTEEEELYEALKMLREYQFFHTVRLLEKIRQRGEQ